MKLIQVFFQNRPNNNVILDPIDNSPLLKRLGKTENAFTTIGQHLTMEEWVRLRQMQQQRRHEGAKVTKDGKFEYKKDDLQIVPGLHATIHN